MAFSETIRKAREEYGLTQEELAGRVGVSQPLIAHIERGTKVPTAALISDIADVLHVSTDRLYGKEQSEVGRIDSKK